MTLCAECKINCTFQQRRVRKITRGYDNSVTDESVGQRTAIDSNGAFRLHVYLSVGPNGLSYNGEFERRFSDDAALTVLRL